MQWLRDKAGTARYQHPAHRPPRETAVRFDVRPPLPVETRLGELLWHGLETRLEDCGRGGILA